MRAVCARLDDENTHVRRAAVAALPQIVEVRSQSATSTLNPEENQ